MLPETSRPVIVALGFELGGFMGWLAGRGVLGTLMVATLFAPAAEARQRDPASRPFYACDGFGPPVPSEDSDGATPVRTTWYVVAQEGDEGAAIFRPLSAGGRGIVACDIALTDPRLLPKHRVRLLSLERAKALHRIEAGDPSGGLAALDKVQAASQALSSLWYDRSFGVGLDLARAYGLRRSGDGAGATRLTNEAAQRRPWDVSTLAAAQVAMGDQHDPETFARLERRLAALDPHQLDLVFQRAWRERRYEDVVILGPQLVEPIREQLYIRTGAIVAADVTRSEAYWAERSGQRAYALAALGREAEARVLIAAMRARAASVADPAGGQVSDYYWIHEKETAPFRPGIGARLAPIIDVWAWLVDQRIRIAANEVDGVIAAVTTSPPPADLAGLELLDAIQKSRPEQTGASADYLRRLRATVANRTSGQGLEPNAADLFITLPEIDLLSRIEGYKGAKARPGRYIAKELAPSSEAVVFRNQTHSGSPSIAGELILLEAADYTLKAGKPAFVIVHRHDTRVGFNFGASPVQPGQVMRNDGYESELMIMPVDLDALPVFMEGSPWRALPAREIYDALFPIYDPQVRKQAKKK